MSEGPTTADMIAVTQQLIDYDGHEVVLHRPPDKMRQPDGSQKRTNDALSDLDSQSFFIGGVTGDDLVITSWEGQRVEAPFVIVGMPTADMREGDIFELWNRKFRIVKINPDKRWEHKGWCMTYG